MVVKIYNCKRTAVHFSSEISSRPKSSIGEMEKLQQKTTTFTYILGGIATPVNIFAQPCTANDCITIP